MKNWVSVLVMMTAGLASAQVPGVFSDVTANGNYNNSNGVIIPSTITGPHGTGPYIQLGDGTGVSGNLAGFDVNGNITNSTGSISNGRIPVNVANGVSFWGNSECADVGASPASLGWASRFVATYMVGTVNSSVRRCITGGFSADAINFGALSRATTTLSLTPFVMPSYGAQLTFIQSLENDANNNTSLNAALLTASKEQDFALIALGTTPLDQQIQATNTGWTCSGSVGTDDYFGSILPGTILTSGQTCSTTITTVQASNSLLSNPIDLLYSIFSGDSGTGTVTIDGVVATDSVTGSSTLTNAPFGGAALLTGSCCSFTRTLALARFIPTSIGSHTVIVTGVTTGTNGFGLQSLFTAPVGIPSYAAPTAIKLGVLRQQGDAAATATAAYDAMSLADCNQMAADGFRCIFAPVRGPFITSANLSFMMSSSSAFTSGAVRRTNMTFTASSNSISSATNFDASYTGKIVICTNGLTSSTDYAGVVSSFNITTPTVMIVSPAIGNSSGAGTGVCTFGTNSQVTLGSAAPGLHPDNAGHDAELQGVMSRTQPVTLPPNFNQFINFPQGIATNLGQSGGVFNLNFANNTPLTTLTSLPWCVTLFGINPTSTISGLCFSRDTVKSNFFTGVVSQFNTQTKIGDQNATTYLNGSFRWDWVFDPSAGGQTGVSNQGMFFNNGLDSYTTTTLGSEATLNAPASKFVLVTGTNAISAITLPAGSASMGSAASSPAAVGYAGCINFIASGGTVGTNAWSVTAGSTILTGFQAVFGQQYQGCYDGTNWRFSGLGIGATPRTCNANGCYKIDADGTITQWGVTGAGCGGSAACNSTWTFPIAFTTTSDLSVTVSAGGGGANNFIAGTNGSPTTTGFTIQYLAATAVGGAGTTLPGTQTASWIAIGH